MTEILRKIKKTASCILLGMLCAGSICGCAGKTEGFYEDTALRIPETESRSGNSAGVPADGVPSAAAEPVPDGDFEECLSDRESLFINRAPLFYYYTRISEEEKILYDALFAVARDPSTTEFRKKAEVETDPSSDAFVQELTVAYEALIYDHPELFWFRQNGGNFKYYYKETERSDGKYTVMVQLSTAYERYEEEMTAFNRAAEEFLAGIDLDQSDPYIALEIHDRLIDLVSYDDELASIYLEDGSYDYGYSAYGALVENSRGQANRAVCDGYSYAYEYLLQQAGILSARVGGYAGNETDGLMPHSWNLVCLDGEWYETDPTWDDRDPEFDEAQYGSEILDMAAADEAFWERIRHCMYDRTTEEMSFFVPDWTYTYYTPNGYVSFLGNSTHVRSSAQEDGRAVDYLSRLAPIAEGTQYSYDNLTGFDSGQ